MKSAQLTVIVGGLALSGMSFALGASLNKAPQSTTLNNTLPSVVLYATPKMKSNIIERVSPQHQFVTIFDNGQWVKVGNPYNGNVGWLNKAQYLKAYSHFTAAQSSAANYAAPIMAGHIPSIQVVAFQNGRALSALQTAQLLGGTISAINGLQANASFGAYTPVASAVLSIQPNWNRQIAVVGNSASLPLLAGTEPFYTTNTGSQVTHPVMSAVSAQPSFIRPQAYTLAGNTTQGVSIQPVMIVTPQASNTNGLQTIAPLFSQSTPYSGQYTPAYTIVG